VSPTRQHIYSFGDGKAEAKTEISDLLGGKGANLVEMAKMGVPVPPGFTIISDACTFFLENGKYPGGLESELDDHLSKLEEAIGATLGDDNNPLILSVRSGARMSMPGMMDTILNLGLTDSAVRGLVSCNI